MLNENTDRLNIFLNIIKQKFSSILLCILATLLRKLISAQQPYIMPLLVEMLTYLPGMRAYLTYVQPIVEHDSIIWSPYTIKDIEYVETVQRRFTKRLPGFRTLPYTD